MCCHSLLQGIIPGTESRSPVFQADSLLSELPRKPKEAYAAAKSLQSCPTLCDPIDGAHQALPSLGFSRQEHWSGLPFPSPMHESEKGKGSRSVVSDSSNPMDCSPPGSSIHGIFQARVLEWGVIAFSATSHYILRNPFLDPYPINSPIIH